MFLNIYQNRHAERHQIYGHSLYFKIFINNCMNNLRLMTYLLEVNCNKCMLHLYTMANWLHTCGGACHRSCTTGAWC